MKSKTVFINCFFLKLFYVTLSLNVVYKWDKPMYLWVIIATFIAALFAMSTSLRPDIKELYVEPQAQTVVTKLYVQHRAAMNYLSSRNRNDTSSGMGYRQGELTADMLQANLPYGFQQDSGFTRFTTWVYCLDKNRLESGDASALPSSCTAGLPPDGGTGGTGDGTGTGGGDGSGSGDGSGDSGDDSSLDVSCCSGSSVAVYLVTYGCVPSKWRDVRSGKPDAMLLGAMKTTTGYTHGMGYAIDRDEVAEDIYQGASSYGDSMYGEDIETNMGVYGQGGQFYVPIPNYISETSEGERSFANVCGSRRKNNEDYDPNDPQSVEEMWSSCDYCLVYMSRF